MKSSAIAAPSAAWPSPATDAVLTIGIDVGGTKIACVVTDADDHVLMHEVEPTQADRLTGQLSSLVRRTVEQVARETDQPVVAVGVAVPGHVEPGTGSFSLAVNLGSSNVPLGPTLQDMVRLPVYLEHDARSAAAWIHAATGVTSAAGKDLAYLSVGTGIAAGIILNGRVFRGANGLAGEVGHVVADPDGPVCACGLRGCLEMVAAGPAISRAARDAVASMLETSLPQDATAADVFRAAAAGDEVAVGLVTTVVDSLARAIRGLLLTLGVTRIVIGGGVASAGDDLLNPLLAAIARERASSPFADAAFAQATVEFLSPRVEAGARGAAAIARQRFQALQREGVGER